MDTVNDPSIWWIVFMASSQVGKTEFLNNVIAYFMDHDPAPIMMLQPTIDMAEAWSKDRLAPMLRDTPALHAKVKDAKSRDSGNTILHKTFPGGHLTATGANSPAGLASRPIRILLPDEIDRFPMSAGTEGDPLDLAMKRTTTFWNRKVITTSTPTIKGLSRIERAYEQSDMRRRWVPCRYCNEFQILKWSRIQWPSGNPSAAVYVCENDKCGGAIEEHQKFDMLMAGAWRTEKETRGIAGFHINELYSTFSTWGRMAEAFVKAKGFKDSMRVWINTSLGETWREEIEGDSLDSTALENRKEEYTFGTFPPGAAVVLVTVDTQNDRLEVNAVAWGPGQESWRVGREIIIGDPNLPGTWDELDLFLDREYDHPNGAKIKARACAIDSGGGRTDAVYDYCASPKHPIPVFAFKGANRREAPLIDVDKQGRVKFTVAQAKSRKRLKLYMVGVHQGKELLFSRLKQETPGAGYMHFSEDCPPEYFKQLGAEVRVPRFSYGQPYYIWELISGRRNEALDLEVLQLALLRIVESAGVDLATEAEKVNAEPSAHGTGNAEPAPQQPRKKSSMAGW